MNSSPMLPHMTIVLWKSLQIFNISYFKLLEDFKISWRFQRAYMRFQWNYGPSGGTNIGKEINLATEKIDKFHQ